MSRVLTIEDDAITAQEIVAELGNHGLQVDWVADGREGLVRAASGDYDAITLDRRRLRWSRCWTRQIR